MDFPAGPWMPDQSEVSSLLVADGVIPKADGYGPFPSLSVSTSATALATAPRGAFGFTTAGSSWKLAVGEDTKVRLMASDYSFTDIDTGLTPTSGYDFSFAQFGTKLLYTNTTDGLRAYDVESGGAASAVAAAKNPAWIFQIGNQIAALNCLDSTGSRSNRLLRLSAYSSHTNWTGAGADYQPIDSGGGLIWGGAVTGTSGILLQERAAKVMTLGSFGGASFRLDNIADEFGSVGARSCATVNGRAFWLSTDGFRMWYPGLVEPNHIGAGRVDTWLFDRIDQGSLYLTLAAIDPYRKNVLWAWKRSSGSSTTVFSDIIGYNWAFDKWFTLTTDVAYLCYLGLPAATWDAYDAAATWDSVSYVWDDRVLSGGQPVFAGFSSAYKFGSFSGTSMAATVTHNVANNPVTGLVNWADPVTDSANATLALGVKDELSDGITYKTAASKVSSGRVPLRGRGKNINFKTQIPAAETWTYYKGVDHVSAVTGGPR